MTTTTGPGPAMPSAAAQSEAASTVGVGVPLLVSGDADLVAKDGTEQDSWFLICHLDSERGVLDLMIHYIRITPPEGEPFVQAIGTVLDPVTNAYYADELVYPTDACTFSRESYDVRTPNGGMSGDSSAMRVTADFPHLVADLTLRQDGPMLANLGTGLLPFYGDINYEYSFPTMSTSGTVTVAGQTYPVTGSSWFDRQWGRHSARFWTDRKWTWFGITLDNGDRISLWDYLDSGREHAFATVLHPNGLHEVVDVEPLGSGSSNLWTSEQSGHTYPTRWDVSIPVLDGRLVIEPLITEQEVVSPITSHKYEGASTVSGEIRGTAVTGRAVAELVGSW